MKKLSLVLIVVLGLGMISAGMVQADPIAVDTPLWYAFLFGLPGPDAVGSSIANSTNPGNPPWTYTAATATNVKITDSFTAGDMFNLYDFGAFIGTTSTVPDTATGTNNPSPDVDYLDPLLSHGLFTLPAGPHSLTITTFQNAQGNTDGVAFFRVDGVPIPPSAWLLGSGLFGLLGWRRFRKG
jgi:hypothetical protein